MTLFGPLTLALVNAIVLALALYVRGGGTWVLSGYDRGRVADEKGLAVWCGTGLALVGATGVVAAGVLAVAPRWSAVAVVGYGAAVLGGIWLISRGARRFLRSA
ncbi:MAG TPA: hypothetical protein VGF28_24420 [Thermoanaerobaculia bacterium]|jgi:hypothetical protein